MQLENAPDLGALLPNSGKPKNQFEIGVRNITCRFFRPLNQGYRVIPKILAEPCILKLFCFIESIKIKVIQVYARNHVNFNQRIGRAFHRTGVPQGPQHGAYERGFPRPQIAIQPDDHPGSQQGRQFLPERDGRALVGNRQRQGSVLAKRAMIGLMQGMNSDTDSSATQTSNAIDLSALAGQIKQWGLELGFSGIGITRADASQAAPGLEHWLALGRHGGMDYMAKHAALRSCPDLLVPGTLSIISVRLPYWQPGTRSEQVLADNRRAYISRYALGRDYHKTIRQRLQRLAGRIGAQVQILKPGFDFAFRAFSDSAPVLEVEYARQSGIAWRGKHTLSLTREGSWHFLGEIYTNLPLPPDTPIQEHCGSCRRCIDACPTAAIVAPYEVDARLCISYLTIELSGPIPIPLRPLIGNRIYGCDDCQLCCPWNSFASLGDPDFAVRNGLDAASLPELFTWTEEDFNSRLAGSPIRRIGHERWLRNIAVALGNSSAEPATLSALESRRNDPSALVQEHVNWAMEHLHAMSR